MILSFGRVRVRHELDPSPTRASDYRRWATLSVLCVTLLLISLDNTVLNVALPTIARSLGASASQLQWMVDAYAVVFAGLLLSLGALGDRAGRKWVFIGGLVVFGGGSAFAAWSPTPDVLTVARAVMGVGAAALMPCTLSILTNVFTTERDRVRAIGIWSGHHGDWRCLGADLGRHPVGAFLVGFGVPGQRTHSRAGHHRGDLARAGFEEPGLSSSPDPIGAFLSMLGLGLLALGHHRGSRDGDGVRPRSWAPWRPPRSWWWPSSCGNAASITRCCRFVSSPVAATAWRSRP